MEQGPQFFNPYSDPPPSAPWNPAPNAVGNAATFGDYGMANGAGNAGQPVNPSPIFPNPMNAAIYGVGSDFIRSGLGAYGEKLFGNSKDYVQSNMSRYFSPRALKYYFQVNENYVKNKLKILLLPFLHRGHWTRIAEQVGGVLMFKPPCEDTNAPDLYIPVVSFFSYVILSAFAIAFSKKFTPDVLHLRTSRGFIAWIVHWIVLRFVLYTLGNSSTAYLDLVAYAGYAFVGVSVSLFSYLLIPSLYYFITVWTSLCMGYFLLKTMKRVLFVESRNFEQDSFRHRYTLILLALSQLPLALWLGKL